MTVYRQPTGGHVSHTTNVKGMTVSRFQVKQSRTDESVRSIRFRLQKGSNATEELEYLVWPNFNNSGNLECVSFDPT